MHEVELLLVGIADAKVAGHHSIRVDVEKACGGHGDGGMWGCVCANAMVDALLWKMGIEGFFERKRSAVSRVERRF